MKVPTILREHRIAQIPCPMNWSRTFILPLFKLCRSANRYKERQVHFLADAHIVLGPAPFSTSAPNVSAIQPGGARPRIPKSAITWRLTPWLPPVDPGRRATLATPRKYQYMSSRRPGSRCSNAMNLSTAGCVLLSRQRCEEPSCRVRYPITPSFAKRSASSWLSISER